MESGADADIREMAEKCYGYGRWDAPYWFIGPEQGLSRGNMQPRIEAWLHLGRETGLSDCRKFHTHIGETRWHREKPQIQRTWKQLMLLLLTFLGESAENESLRIYQRDQWGMLHGETCVIELSGLPAHDLKAGKEQNLKLFTQEQIDCVLQKRADFIRRKALDHKPRLVVMYGLGAKAHFEKIAGQPFGSGNLLEVESTLMALTTHPVSFEGVKNEYWVSLGKKLRARAGSIQPRPAF